MINKLLKVSKKASSIALAAVMVAFGVIAGTGIFGSKVMAVDKKSTADYVKEILGDAFYYGVVSETFYASNHLETNMATNELISN